MTDQTFKYAVRIDSLPLVEIEATNLFLAAAGAVGQSGARNIKTIVVELFSVKCGPTIFDDSNMQILADELFRLSPLAEGFEVEETNREGDIFYFIDPESNVIELTLGQLLRVKTPELGNKL
jgi:hypothetical protein